MLTDYIIPWIGVVCISIIGTCATAQESEFVKCTIHVQPDETQRFEEGDQITLTVLLKTTGLTRGLGLAIGLEIVDAEHQRDHFAYTVLALPEQLDAIEQAKETSLLWFSVLQVQ